MTASMLKSLGNNVLTAITPGEAIRKASEYDGNIQILVTDVIMPEMNGRELAKNLLQIYPDMKRVFMSGYTSDVIAHKGVLDDGVYFIQKPFSIRQLSMKVREAIDCE
jgi:two-component system cell cycle sensor histidine kinase/response regulator CckA